MKQCKSCGIYLPDEYEDELCEMCLEELGVNTPDFMKVDQSIDEDLYI